MKENHTKPEVVMTEEKRGGGATMGWGDLLMQLRGNGTVICSCEMWNKIVPPFAQFHWGFLLADMWDWVFVCLCGWEGVACEEATRKQRPSEVWGWRWSLRNWGGLVVVLGLNARSTAVRHQRFTGPSPPAPLRTKATTKLTDESQMSRQSSKMPSQPRRQGIRNTHTTDYHSRSAEEEGETERWETVPL